MRTSSFHRASGHRHPAIGRRGVAACLGVVAAYLLARSAGGAETVEPVDRGGVALVPVTAGVFRDSLIQGLEFDLVNTNDRPVICDVRMVLQRAEPGSGTLREAGRTEREHVALPARSRQGFRVAEPLTYGDCRVDYAVKVDGAALAEGRLEFHSVGPYRLEVRPWYLLADAVQATVVVLRPDAGQAHFRFKLLDARGRRVLYQTDEYERRVEDSPYVKPGGGRVTAETLVRIGGRRPGRYVIEVDVLASGSNSAVALAQLRAPVDLGGSRL